MNMFERRKYGEQIISIALDRLDVIITAMNVSTSVIATSDYAGVAHDLVAIIGLAANGLEVKEGEA